MVILITGLPAAGKSTLARRYAREHPNARVVELDELVAVKARELENGDDPWPTARDAMLDAVRSLLRAGHDVLVPQFFGTVDEVRELETASVDAGAAFVEVVLRSASINQAARRHRERDATAVELDFAAMVQQLERVVRARPETIAIDSINGDVDGTLAALLAALDTPANPTMRRRPAP